MKKSNSVVKVDLNKIRHNLDVIGRHLRTGVKQMAVVKADAYGHGSVEVAEAVRGKAEWLAVNELAEAVELREAGIMEPILVFEPPLRESAEAYKRYNLTATLSSPDHFDLLPSGTRYHLNIDTGMGRLGFLPEQLSDIKRKMEEAGELICTGIYSHFATSDEPGSPPASRQLKMFKSIRAEFEPELLTHMCNTGGSVFYPEAQFDMVRSGIGMYGYPPGPVQIPGLQPALAWHTQLMHVKKVKKGAAISYGAVWTASEDSYIGILPVGYADGIRRNLTGKLEVRAGTSICPVVGRITMNYCMVLLGKHLPPDDRVEILDGETLTASTWSDHLKTIPYEILTGISPYIPRMYS